MSELVIREMREQSLANFISHELAEGCTAISAVVSQAFDVSLGRLYLIMPEDFVPEEPERKGYWNWTPNGLKSGIAEGALARVVAAYLRDKANRFLIQDYWFRRGHKADQAEGTFRAYRGQEQLWELQGSDVAESMIESCIGDASYWPWLGYFCKARDTVASSREFTDDDLKEVAARLVGIVVQALHDSFVIWWRPDIELFPQVPELQ